MIGEASIEDCDSMGIVIDRSGIEEARKCVQAMEEMAAAPGHQHGGWSIGLTLFEGLENMRYLLMVCDSPERVENCAPTVGLCDRESVLRMALLTQCKGLGEGTATFWMCFGEDATHDMMGEFLGQPLGDLPDLSSANCGKPQFAELTDTKRGLH